MQDEDWAQVQGDMKVPYLAKSAIGHYDNQHHWLDMQQCSLSIARHERSAADRTTHQHTSIKSPLLSTHHSKPDAVDLAKPETRTVAIDDQSYQAVQSSDAHKKADWQMQRRSKRSKGAKNPDVLGPTSKQILTLMDLWGKKQAQTDKTKKAQGADLDDPRRGF